MCLRRILQDTLHCSIIDVEDRQSLTLGNQPRGYCTTHCTKTNEPNGFAFASMHSFLFQSVVPVAVAAFGDLDGFWSRVVDIPDEISCAIE